MDIFNFNKKMSCNFKLPRVVGSNDVNKQFKYVGHDPLFILIFETTYLEQKFQT